MDGTVLIADDDRTLRTVLTQAMTRAGCRVHATSSLTTLLRWVAEGKGDLVITDVVMPDGNGLEMLPKIAQDRPDLPVIVISAQNTIMTAIQAAEAEAFDYLPKPFDLRDLMKRAARALDQPHGTQSDRTGPAPGLVITAEPEALPLVGRSPRMQALYRLIARVMNTDLPVLIQGENGTGKSLIARILHELGERSDQPMLRIEAIDFDAARVAQRISSEGRGGTILIDEIADFDRDAQAALVRMIDSLPRPAPRLIATSRADLQHEIAEGRLREDLFYRLGGITLDVPPLRDRIEDIPLLIEHFLQLAEQDGALMRRMSEPAMAAARTFPWPGNVRQLEYAVRRLLATGSGREISLAELELALGGPDTTARHAPNNGDLLSDAVAHHLQRYFDLHGDDLPAAGLYQRILREIEIPLLEIALEATGGNQARCADLLGINRNTLRKKLTDLDIRVTRRRQLM